MKKEKICIHKDEKYENQVISTAPRVQQALQDLVNQFNALQLGDIAPNELLTLATDPRAVYQARIDRKIEIPAGLNRQKYLEMVDLPDFRPVQQAHGQLHKHTDFDLNAYSLEGNKVETDMAVVQQLATSQHVFIEAGSREHELYQDLITLMQMLNKFDDLLPEPIVSAAVSNPLKRVFDTKQANAVGTRHEYVFSLENFRRISTGKKIRVFAPALS